MVTQINIDNSLSLQTHELNRAEELFNVIDQNRAYLRQWLPWLDSSLTVSDTENFIKSTLKKQEAGSGLSFVILFKGNMVGTINKLRTQVMLQPFDLHQENF